ncbi:LON peptidase substrate-binding domain-containing protein [Microbacteriaceae bacterium VKM Ac-2855]|nr:LON peptidase substrate-binding domain-containing protein [Microbacteriaceae bacterium VKM Ac-2855]
MTDLPIFPLGSVLLPHMPLALRLFEPRYLTMLAEMIQAEKTDFGVVLIERGQEVGGGERRFDVGTIAEITEVAAGDDSVELIAVGGARFDVVEWLPDDPYPRATLRMRDPLEWSDSLSEERIEAEAAVRRALAVASEFEEQAFAATVELATDPVAACWQLAGIVPAGEIDQQAFLRAPTLSALLTAVHDRADEAIASYTWR